MTRRSAGGVVVSAFLVVFSAGIASGQTESRSIRGRAIDRIEFRERLMEWALASERALGPGMQLSEKIAALSDEQLALWLSSIADPNAFLDSTERVVRRLREARPRRGEHAAKGTGAPPTTLGATTLTTPYPPDYPPASGPYNDVILGAITGFGIAASATDGCDASDWGSYVAVWWPLNKAIDTLEGACVVAGCDPTGIACAVACGVLETAKIALKVAAVPLEACDVHGGAVDGAEIEATYENTLGLVGDVAHVHGDLAAHDASISSQIAAHDASIQALLATLQGGVAENQRLIKMFMARQLEIMRLLITPDGRRQINVDVLTCTGDNCPTYPGFQFCSDGSMGWNCSR